MFKQVNEFLKRFPMGLSPIEKRGAPGAIGERSGLHR
jgi:hypothetical protein